MILFATRALDASPQSALGGRAGLYRGEVMTRFEEPRIKNNTRLVEDIRKREWESRRLNTGREGNLFEKEAIRHFMAMPRNLLEAEAPRSFIYIRRVGRRAGPGHRTRRRPGALRHAPSVS